MFLQIFSASLHKRMVKVRDEPSMAEPRPTTTTTTTTTTATGNGTATTVTPQQFSGSRKPPRNPHYYPHSFYHFPTYYHHHCTYPTEGAETNGGGGASGSSSPAKFYFGPGFEPQQQGGGRYGAGPSQTQSNEHVVLFHVNPGVTISFQFGDNMEVLRGKW